MVINFARILSLLQVNTSTTLSVKFSDRRIKTKLYKSGNGQLIHVDVNASLNILRKVVPTAFSLGIGGVVVRPVGVIPGK
ncbi:hypothetical protein [Cuspidothrix issatschenkoi]|uniref:hypothetical protein n=1 Tax=Cuspidothrix issatschenkoi TaxID=230752 RepID=UPI001FAF62C3|nr:hypothetical protein [Cuspidothrix issatschenkoi]